jgi:aryl-alcohol dehydrogenase-like predicted oxidoreductase
MPAMSFNEPTTLGRTGLKVGRLGIASGYRAPTEAIEEAFERGCNYFTWGTVVKGFVPTMAQALRNIAAKGGRDGLVLSMFTYAHWPFMTERLFRRGLKSVGFDRADGLIIGYYSHKPPRRVVDAALKMKAQGIIRFVGLSTHNRKLVPKLAAEGEIGVFHVRYNAAHRGAETEIFPSVGGEGRPGMVAFTATRWSQLLNPKKMPPGEAPATAADCYRFVLSHPGVDVCITGAKTVAQMRENLKVLEAGPMNEAELARMRRIGDYVHSRGKK